MLGERVRRFANLLLASFPNYDLRGPEMYRKWKASTAHCATPLQPRSARSGRVFSSALSPVPKCQNGEDHRSHEERDNQDGGPVHCGTTLPDYRLRFRCPMLLLTHAFGAASLCGARLSSYRIGSRRKRGTG